MSTSTRNWVMVVMATIIATASCWGIDEHSDFEFATRLIQREVDSLEEEIGDLLQFIDNSSVERRLLELGEVVLGARARSRVISSLETTAEDAARLLEEVDEAQREVRIAEIALERAHRKILGLARKYNLATVRSSWEDYVPEQQ